MGERKNHDYLREGKKTTLKDEVLDFIRTGQTVSFVQLKAHFGERFEGEYGMFSSPESNILFWDHISIEFADILRQLVQEKKIYMKRSDLMTYTMAGYGPEYPLAKRPPKDGYRDIHWLPVIFSIA